MATPPTADARAEKVKQIFAKFDAGGDGGLDRSEMAALVVAVNPRVKFSDEQINAILDEVFRTYGEFIDPDRGLTLAGLVRTYEDGAGDVDRDFRALGLPVKDSGGWNVAVEPAEQGTSSTTEEQMKRKVETRDTLKLVEDLEILVTRLRGKQMRKEAKSKGGGGGGGGGSVI